MIDLDQYDSAKNARDHKNRELAKAVWFLLTACAFGMSCYLLVLSWPAQPSIGLLAAICLFGLMSIFYAMITYVQALNYWEDDMDGMLPREGGWRF